jgi:cytochrome d ubiquinol oxidase subunit I
LLKHDSDAEIKGIDAFSPDTAPVTPVFFAFRAMVGLGALMLVAAWWGAWATRGGALPPRWMLWTLAGFTFSGWAATLCGWLVTEIGRQPWLVTGILRTADAVGADSGAQLGASLTGYVITYTGMFLAYMVVLTHLAGKGTQA